MPQIVGICPAADCDGSVDLHTSGLLMCHTCTRKFSSMDEVMPLLKQNSDGLICNADAYLAKDWEAINKRRVLDDEGQGEANAATYSARMGNEVPLFQLAQRITDSILGEGEYERLNGFNPNATR